MIQRVTIGAVLLSAALFGWGVPLLRLFDAVQPIVVALSIMIGAILVRLNRGMPSLDWKSLNVDEKRRLTTAIVSLTREYIVIVAVNSLFLALLVCLIVVGKSEVQNVWSSYAQHFAACSIGAFAALSIARMTYVIWRDYDIVRLQKELIDASGMRDDLDLEIKSATQKVADIRATSLKKYGTTEMKPWSD